MAPDEHDEIAGDADEKGEKGNSAWDVVSGVLVLVLLPIVVPLGLLAWVSWRIWVEVRYISGGSAYRLRELRRHAFFPRRYGGWWFEVEGRKVALIDRPEFSDMFWARYRLFRLDDTLPLTPPDSLLDYWGDHVQVRAVDSGVLPPLGDTFPGGHVDVTDGRVRVEMRSLWPPRPTASLCARFVLRWCLRRQRGQNGTIRRTRHATR